MEKTTTTTSSKDLPSESVDIVNSFLARVGAFASLPENCTYNDCYSDLIRDLLKADQVQRGRVSCVFSVHPVVGVIFLHSAPFFFFLVFLCFLADQMGLLRICFALMGFRITIKHYMEELLQL